MADQVDINRKYKKYPDFKKEMDEIEDFYNAELNLALYENLDRLQERCIFDTIQEGNRATIVFYGFKMDPEEEDIQRLYRLYIRTCDQLMRKEVYQYSIVFFNSLCSSNDAFRGFKSLYRTLPKMYYSKLDRIYIVHSIISVNFLDWIVIGRLAKLFSKRLEYVKNIEDLLKFKISNKILNILPREIVDFAQQKEPSGIKYKEKEMQAIPPKKKKDSPFEFLKILLEKHEMSQEKIPKLLKTLLLAFKKNPAMLDNEGIFRKSGNIEEEEQLVIELAKKNDKYIDAVTDGYVIAGLVKKFFTHLIEPVLPYETYEKIMHASGITVEKEVSFAQEIMTKIPQLNNRIIVLMISFMKEQVIKRQAITKMTEYNCAVVFAPCFSRPKNPDFADLIGTGKVVKFLTILFSKFQEIFGSKSDKWDLCRVSPPKPVEPLLGEENRASSESPKRSSNEEANKKALNEKQINS